MDFVRNILAKVKAFLQNLRARFSKKVDNVQENVAARQEARQANPSPPQGSFSPFPNPDPVDPIPPAGNGPIFGGGLPVPPDKPVVPVIAPGQVATPPIGGTAAGSSYAVEAGATYFFLVPAEKPTGNVSVDAVAIGGKVELGLSQVGGDWESAKTYSEQQVQGGFGTQTVYPHYSDMGGLGWKPENAGWYVSFRCDKTGTIVVQIML